MKRIFLSLALLTGLAQLPTSSSPIMTCRAQTSVAVVERPELGSAAYRAPLHGGYLRKLPVGQVQPRGWLREFLNRQRAGLNGQLGTVSDWLDKNGNQWLSDTGSHGWEEVPYWLRGYASLAYVLDDEAMKREAQVWFDAVMTHLKPNGELGPSGTDGNPETPDLWAKMPMLWALQTYYEASGDERVLQAMTRYFKWELTIPDEHFLKGLWQAKRGGDNEWSVVWLYNQTGDETILPLISKLHRCGVDWTMKDDLPNWHGVNVAQGFREPATTYVLTGESRLLDAAYENFSTMRRRYGQVPGGMYGADENARAGYFDPRQGTETCALVEQMASDEILMGLTGDPFWADHCEDVALNSYAAALMPDMRSLRYLTAPNMAVSDERLHGPSIDNNLRGMLSMSPFSSRCCQHNHGMGWPYYAEHLVMATADGGLATMLYAASETRAHVADRQEVVLTEETHYPFEEQVALTLHTASAVRFPLYLRIPAWAEGAEVCVNDDPVGTTASAGRYVRLLREWQDGDRVRLTLPMRVSSRVWAQNKNSVSVNYGPLTLSLKIDTEVEQHDSRDPQFNQDDSHWQQGVDAALWPCYVLKPRSDWNYALKVDESHLPVGLTMKRKAWPADDFPFTLESVPLEFRATGRQIPSWGLDATGMTDVLPDESEPRSEKETALTLVPMGAARLRIAAFPTCSNDARK